MEQATMKRNDKKPRVPKGTDPDQAYHWTPEWQEGEREVEAELVEGNFTVYETIDDMFDDMDRLAS
jgi:hypothetical protein